MPATMLKPIASYIRHQGAFAKPQSSPRIATLTSYKLPYVTIMKGVLVRISLFVNIYRYIIRPGYCVTVVLPLHISFPDNIGVSVCCFQSTTDSTTWFR